MTDCILWEGAVNSAGYGHFNKDNTWIYAHRDAYAQEHGPIPAGMYVLHHCDVKRCINPAHLFLGTQFDNMQDHASKGRHHYGQRTHCKNGHEYTSANTKTNERGWRICRECIRINNAKKGKR